jgi:hypothetical protein
MQIKSKSGLGSDSTPSNFVRQQNDSNEFDTESFIYKLMNSNDPNTW